MQEKERENAVNEQQIYLDYAANTPVDQCVLNCYCQAAVTYMGNPNSKHHTGLSAKEAISRATAHMAELLQVQPEELIFTSSASESNNLAIKGIAHTKRHTGKHIISTCLEHSSVSGALTFLQEQGYEIDLVQIQEDGTIDLSHLKRLLRQDTILVSICAVDSELGTVQPISEISKILTGYPNCTFHVDATQAVGKIPFSCADADLVSFAPHKFYGLGSSGILYKKQSVILEPLIHGGASTTIYRSGTPDTAMILAMERALELGLLNLSEHYAQIQKKNQYLREQLAAYPLVLINSPQQAIPHVLNLSVKGVKAAAFQQKLDENGVAVSTKSACSVPNTPSRAVYAVTHDRKRAMCSWRISLSHLTTDQELQRFLEIFRKCYQELTNA